ncbi:glycoside hydrolase N-terminal domain-containing protein [Acidobacterium sp. S8]|uniref:glycoside hydrolase family 95 protein n=1 Tax=Acidobacterium sp. S8 TaxID=1641854 RepID=UPI0020B13EB8|nr:glycoside hydrolase family 95 protein [Acidobacterium sp. S8]
MQTTRRRFLQGGLALAAIPKGAMQLWSATRQRSVDELWYRQPAERWLEALPVGNGRLGGMVFGGLAKERIALSESTAWSGAPSATDVNPEALKHLDEIRQLLFAGKYVEARGLCEKHLLGNAKSFGTNMPLPELRFDFGETAGVIGYRRSLNLDEAAARMSFVLGGARFSREVIASHPDGVIAVRLSCSKPGQITFTAAFGAVTLPADITTNGRDTLILRGHAYEHMHSNGQDGVALQIHAKIIAEGGSLQAEAQNVHVKNANSVTVLIAAATSFRDNDPEAACTREIASASRKTYATLRAEHVADHQSLYRRVSLDLGASGPSMRTKPTDVRRKGLEDGGSDPELLALFFQYGRYLTITGSRADSPLPLALQGIWNDGLASTMGWTNDFHLDINTQQNYWAAELCNLSECQTPLFGLIEGLREAGRRTAKEMYGAPGWVCHTVTNAWGYTAPGWGIGWGLYVTAGIWIALQMWDHYTFNADTEFLRAQAYPALREAAEFFLAYMVPEPKHGWLVTGPSDSPENWYLTADGEHCAESMGNTCDRVFVYALYSVCIEAQRVLSVDGELRERLEAARAKLPPFQIGKHGQLQEWLEDFEDAEPNHRHTSHLVALYPENQISPRKTPELARAAEVTIERRMNTPHWEQSEWGRANLVVYYARLLKGDLAHKYLESLVAKAADVNLLTFSSGGVAGAEQNIFAIDGNTAGTAGMAEMLLQSQGGEIRLLPALPAAWQDGTVKGLCARGGYVIDIAWHNGALLSASVMSRRSGSIQVRYQGKIRELSLRAGEVAHLRTASFINSDHA